MKKMLILAATVAVLARGATPALAGSSPVFIPRVAPIIVPRVTPRVAPAPKATPTPVKPTSVKPAQATPARPTSPSPSSRGRASTSSSWWIMVFPFLAPHSHRSDDQCGGDEQHDPKADCPTKD